VSDELAQQRVAPRDAALMQDAEQSVLGETQRGVPAAVLQSVANADATVVEAELGGRCVVTESVGGQVGSKMVTPGVYMSSLLSHLLSSQNANSKYKTIGYLFLRFF